MIFAECKRLAKEGSLIYIVLLAVAAANMLTDNKDVLAPILEIFLLLYAAYIGWSMFDRERQEAAVEYMLTLPVSRSGMLVRKLLPRLVAVAVVFLLYLALHKHFHLPSMLLPEDFFFFYAAFFLISFSFSLSIKNFIGSLFVTTFITLGMTYLLKTLDPTKPDGEAIFQANLPLLVLPLLFILLFQTFDIRPIGYFNLKFAPLATLAIAAIALFNYFTMEIKWGCHFLSGNGSVVRVACDTCRYTEWHGDGQIQRLPGCLHPVGEVNGTIYVEARKQNSIYKPGYLAIVDFPKKTVYPVYALAKGWYTQRWFGESQGNVVGDTLYLLLIRFPSRQEKILVLRGKSVQEIPIKGLSSQESPYFLCQVLNNPRQFLLFSETSLFLVSEAGDAKKFTTADAITIWQDRLLTFSDSGMTLWEIGVTPKILWERSGEIRKLGRARFTPNRWGPIHQPFVLFKENKKTWIFDMATRECRELLQTIDPFYYLQCADKRWIIQIKGKGNYEIEILELHEGQLRLVKTWQSLIARPMLIRVYANGILVNNARDFEVYLFPKK